MVKKSLVILFVILFSAFTFIQCSEDGAGGLTAAEQEERQIEDANATLNALREKVQAVTSSSTPATVKAIGYEALRAVGLVLTTAQSVKDGAGDDVDVDALDALTKAIDDASTGLISAINTLKDNLAVSPFDEAAAAAVVTVNIGENNNTGSAATAISAANTAVLAAARVLGVFN